MSLALSVHLHKQPIALLLRITSLCVAMFVLLCPSPAAAVTPDELIELRRAGLGDDVLIALIETTGMSTPVASDLVLHMRRSGLSDEVIAAAVRAVPSLNDQTSSTVHNEQMPNVAAIGYGPAPAYIIEREVVYVPWVIPVRVRPGTRHRPQPYLEGEGTFGRFINDGFVDRSHSHQRKRRR